MLIISCLKTILWVLIRALATVLSAVLVWILIGCIMAYQSHYTIVSQNWGQAVTIVDGICWVQSTYPGQTREVVQWCRENGATELVVK